MFGGELAIDPSLYLCLGPGSKDSKILSNVTLIKNCIRTPGLDQLRFQVVQTAVVQRADATSHPQRSSLIQLEYQI